MTDRKIVLKALEKYIQAYSDEKTEVEKLISFIKSTPNCFERSNLEGHVTGSAWLINEDGSKVLLHHHKGLNRWLQFGGHSDGEANTWNVALREVEEESGITDISFVTEDIFDIDIHTIPENKKKNEPEHLHYDIRFLLKAHTEEFVISDESNELKWIQESELEDMAKKGLINESMERMHKKAINY